MYALSMDVENKLGLSDAVNTEGNKRIDKDSAGSM